MDVNERNGAELVGLDSDRRTTAVRSLGTFFPPAPPTRTASVAKL
jgi:hypothetical protein